MKTNNINIDMQTKSLLEQGGLEKAPANFTENVMRKLKLAQKPLLADYKPVISKKGWVLISGFMTLLTVVFIITGSISNPGGKASEGHYNEVSDSISFVFNPIGSFFTDIPLYIVFIPIAIIFFYTLDKLLSKVTSRHS